MLFIWLQERRQFPEKAGGVGEKEELKTDEFFLLFFCTDSLRNTSQFVERCLLGISRGGRFDFCMHYV